MSFNFPAKSYDKVANNFFSEIYSRFWEESKNFTTYARIRMNTYAYEPTARSRKKRLAQKLFGHAVVLH